MTIRTILAGSSGGTASNGACELACRLAARFNAQLTALHVRPDIASTVLAAGAEGLAATAAMGSAAEMADTAEAAREQTKAAFAEAAARHDLSLAEGRGTSDQPVAVWHEARGDAAALLASHARFLDLVVLGRSDRIIRAPHTDAIEQTLIHSGRSVLLAPAEQPAVIGDTLAVAWNGSAQAVRALVSACRFCASPKQQS